MRAFLNQRRVCNAQLRQSRTLAPLVSACRAQGQHTACPSVELRVANEDQMAELARLLVHQGLKAGDVYMLYGAVGAGKSVFSRAFIREAMGDDDMPVPSPTFLLQNTYEMDDESSGQILPIQHFDLYRLTGPSQTLERLDLMSSFQRSVCLVEWAERVPVDWSPSSRLDIEISVLNTVHDVSSPSSDVCGVEKHGNGSNADQYTDLRPRSVRLRAHGTYWHERLFDLKDCLETLS